MVGNGARYILGELNKIIRDAFLKYGIDDDKYQVSMQFEERGYKVVIEIKFLNRKTTVTYDLGKESITSIRWNICKNINEIVSDEYVNDNKFFNIISPVYDSDLLKNTSLKYNEMYRKPRFDTEGTILFIHDSIKNVIFNDPATIVIWSDGTKTVVKANNEAYDPEKGLAMAIAKKSLGNKGKFNNEFKKWLPKVETETQEKKNIKHYISVETYSRMTFLSPSTIRRQLRIGQLKGKKIDGKWNIECGL